MPNILITGAGSGLGRDLCRIFAARGHRVTATDVSREAVEETVRMIADGADAAAHVLDVTRDDEVRRVVDGITGPGGEAPVDWLVNNAGLQHVAPLEQFDDDRWRHLIDVMLTGSARMMRAVLPGMQSRGTGRIINIGSIHSLVASPYKSAYVAAKHGLVGLAKTIALETAPWDITVNTICPSYIRTPLVERQIAQQARAHGIPEEEVVEQIMLAPMPKKAFITAEEIAGTIEFLGSPAARNITGQALAVDGGWTIR